MQNELRECNVIVLPVDLLNDRKKTSDPPVQNCCTLRVKEGSLLYCNFSAIFRNLSAIFGNFRQFFAVGFDPPRPQPSPPW